MLNDRESGPIRGAWHWWMPGDAEMAEMSGLNSASDRTQLAAASARATG
jgi:hypothetical protein